MSMENKSITLTTLEILHLAKAANLIPHACMIDEGDEEIEYTIFEREAGVIVADDDKTERTYTHAAFITEYPEEGTFPLGKELGGIE